jgi:hypothetical protein
MVLWDFGNGSMRKNAGYVGFELLKISSFV